MKNLLTPLIFVLVSILFSSCDDIVSYDTIQRKTRTLSIEKITKGSYSFSIVAIAEWHNGCGSFSHYTVLENQNDISITIYGEEPQNAICTQAFIQFEAPVEIIVDGPGEYSLHFWQNDSTSLDTTIVL